MITEPTLYDYWTIVSRRKTTVFCVFSLTVLLTLLYACLQPKVYQSQSVIKLQPPASYSKIPGSGTAEFDSRSSVPTEVLVINSAEISSRVEKKLGRPVNGAARGAADGGYKAERLQNSNLIAITADGPGPLDACDLANAVIEAYREYDLEQKSAQRRKLLAEIVSRRSEVYDNLRSLELVKKEFLRTNLKAKGGEELVSRLIDLEARRRELLNKYTPNHPEVMELDRNIKTLESGLSNIPELEIDLSRIVRELRMQEALYITLNTQCEEAKLGLSSVVSFVTVVNHPAPAGRPSAPDIKIILLMGAVLGIFLSAGAAFLYENFDVSICNLEELEAFLGLPVLGIIPHICNGASIEDRLMKILQRERHGVAAFQRIMIVNPASTAGLIEVYHSLRTNMLLRVKTQKRAAFMFSAAGIAEGKTLTTVNFALASAHSGLKTLLVDADMHRPVIHRIFGIRRRPGLSDVLTGNTEWRSAAAESMDMLIEHERPDELVCFQGIENLKILSSGTPPRDVPETIGSAEWTSLIRDFKTEFDIVVFDTPPVSLFSDPVLISKYMDGTVLVYKAGKIARSALKRAKRQVSETNAPILGVVINDIRTADMDPRYHYYGYDYNISGR